MSTYSPEKRQSNSSTPIRKGRHARTPAVTGSGSDAGRHLSIGTINALPSSTMGLPPGVDPLRLDADETFTRFGVREVQSIEASLRTSHDALTSRLRVLVSERYRDMLGTANTLIDMSSSSSNLVERLESVMKGIHSASANTGSSTDGLTGLLSPVEEKDVEAVSGVAQERHIDLFAIAAATKLIAEAPDEVWTSIDSAMQTRNGHHALSPNSAGSSKRSMLQGRDLSEYQAATNLRAIWFFVLSNASWSWLQEKHSSTYDKDVQDLFPYISRQHSALMPMKSYLSNAAEAGLSDWMEEGHGDWVHSSASYLATITSLISLCLLEGHPVEHTFYLEKRKDTLISRLRSSRRKASNDELIVFVVRYIADTLIHSLRAFSISTKEQNSHLTRLCDMLKSSDQDRVSFPPSGLSVLLTLPSAAILSKHLPEEILAYSPDLKAHSTSKNENILQETKKWSSNLRDESLSQAIPTIIEKFSTVAKIGEIQGKIWSVYDKCCAESAALWGSSDTEIGQVVQDELSKLVQHIDTLLVNRLKQICKLSGEELSSSFVSSTSDALQALKNDSNAEASMDLDSTRFLFETSTASDASSLESLEQRLRTRTKQVQEIISLAERRAELFASETKAYTTAIRRSEEKRARRKAKEEQNGNQLPGSKSAKRKEQDDISASFEISLHTAKKSIAEGLQAASGNLNHLPSNLFLIRLIVALRRSSIFTAASVRSQKTDGIPSKEEDHFLQSLEKVQKGLISSISDKMVKEALEIFNERIDGIAPEHSEGLPVFPSSSLLDALSLLSRSSQSVGIGYRSEETKLRKELMISFCAGWLKIDQYTSQSQRLFDLELLQVILGFGSDLKNVVDVSLKHLGDELKNLKENILSASGIDTKQWSQHTSTHLPPILSRIRLIIASIIVNEGVYVRAMKSNTSTSSNSTGTSIPSQIPPLPLLQLAKARESVPRIRPRVITSSR
ncbi:uncharacterized protein FA14DRAFT_176135 [Meira miltonrushii]|uniref:Conserved oligomeric Golgi complex subunit 1 n=1 Tax=Meira miltonrushii TaxID=1280837 RepID=A0A316VGR1_9BASI|nr:uncharacterized protein FA14DRAFT_176135 [Meira miltonrushii]PWN36829.1 hypothetical protein FA14DRAFT_176135 [Meira miltonrushii]